MILRRATCAHAVCTVAALNDGSGCRGVRGCLGALSVTTALCDVIRLFVSFSPERRTCSGGQLLWPNHTAFQALKEIRRGSTFFFLSGQVSAQLGEKSWNLGNHTQRFFFLFLQDLPLSDFAALSGLVCDHYPTLATAE